MSTLSIKTGSVEPGFTNAIAPQERQAKTGCAALLRESQKSADHLTAVEKYLGELAVLLGGTFTPAP